MNFRKYVFVIIFAIILSGHANAESTTPQKISRIQYNGGAQILYFVGQSKWSGTSCPNATYIQVKGSEVPGIKEIMSIGLSAKMADIDVSFWGDCNTDANHFDAFYIVLD